MRLPYNIRKELEHKGNLVLMAIAIGHDDFAYAFGKELFRYARKISII